MLSETGGSLQKIEVISEKAAYNGAVAFIEYTIDYGDRVEMLSFNDLTNVGAAFTVREEHSNIENYVAMYDDSIILDGREVTHTLSGGYISAYGAYVTKHIMDWYPKINRAGTPQTSVEFEIQKIY